MPPEYHLESFWTDRFKGEEHFEWLGDGQGTIIPIIRNYLRDEGNYNRDKTSAHRRIPRTLHIGAGTSTLSEHIWATYRDICGDTKQSDIIVNTDFSERAVQHGKTMTDIRPGVVRWQTVDMLSWKDVESRLKPEQQDDNEGGFAIVVDKSTSDAISCAPDIHLEPGLVVASVCPLVVPIAADHCTIEPLELLALHLAALVHPMGIWVALSYSSNRFPFLTHAPSATTYPTRAAQFWTIRQIIPVDAPSGQAKEGVHAPAVRHHVYVLERTSRLSKLEQMERPSE